MLTRTASPKIIHRLGKPVLEVRAYHHITAGADPTLGDKRIVPMDLRYPNHFAIRVTDRAIRGI